MRAWRYFASELHRLLCEPLVWAAAIAVMASPLLGLTIYQPLMSLAQTGYSTTMQGMYIANPALAGSIVGSIVFGLLAIRTLNRFKRCRMETIADAAISPLTTAAVQLTAILCLSALVQTATMLAWLPYTATKLGAIFSLRSYLLMYLVFMYGGIPIAIVAASALYQLTQRADVSAISFLAFAALSFTVWVDNWQLSWLNPCVWAVSDDFSNERILRSVAYMRLGWLACVAGLWVLSWLCVRRHGKGIVGSFAENARKLRRPAAATALVACSVFLYTAQPFVDHSAPDLDYSYVEPTEYLADVTCSARRADVRPNPVAGTVTGTAEFAILNTSGAQRDVRFLINPGYDVFSVRANEREIPFHMEGGEEMNEKRFVVTLPEDPETQLSIDYGGYPQEWNLVSHSQGRQEISDEYMVLENVNLAPAPYDIWYEGDSLPATLHLTLPENLTPLLFGPGNADLLRSNEDGTKTWRLEDDGYRMIVYAGDYMSESVPIGDESSIDFYYSKRHAPVMQELDGAALVEQTARYCTDHIGPLRFTEDGVLKLIESRCSGGGYAGGGASLADELDFTAENLESGTKGDTPAQTMIHELVHQWWGLGAMFDPMSAENGWSAEGLTCYTTYRIVKDLYGEEVARQAFVDAWIADVEAYRRDFYVRNPQYLALLPEAYQAEIAAHLTTMEQYSKMPLQILKAEALVGGEAAMDAILEALFSKELNPEYPYLTYADFLDACDLSEEDLELGQNLSL